MSLPNDALLQPPRRGATLGGANFLTESLLTGSVLVLYTTVPPKGAEGRPRRTSLGELGRHGSLG
jgi:hypothetical protein